MITVIDYGMGNICSVTNAIKRYTDKVRISSKSKDLVCAEKIILPGVGAFKDAYDGIERRSLIRPIIDFIGSGRPFLGICLGLQLLFTRSYEDGEHKGFGIIEGEVIAFAKDKGLKVPHMGWNPIKFDGGRKDKQCPILSGIADNASMYFVHSYYPVPVDKKVIAATTEYGDRFCSLLWKENIYAMQFHPEKSQENGLRIIENFVRL